MRSMKNLFSPAGKLFQRTGPAHPSAQPIAFEALEERRVLAAAADAALPHRAVLVNLGTEVPAGFERFERLIELVAEDEASRGAGRARWRHYKDRGYGIRHQDAFAPAGGRA